MRTFRSIPSSGRGPVVFYLDIDHWVFPLAFQYDTVGNNHRPWTFKIEFLCFSLVFCIDPHSR